MSGRLPTRFSNRRLRGNSRRGHVLDVEIRSSTARRQRQEKLGRWIFNLLLVAAIGAAGFFGLRTALDKFFYNNAEYTLNRITLELDNVLTRDEALGLTKLQEGTNIFSVDLAHVETALKAIPQVETVEILRELPDHIIVKVTSRDPVAWVAPEGESADPTSSENSLLVDKSGFLMRPRHIQPEHYHLPIIYGVKSDNIRDGEPLHSEDLRQALNLIELVKLHPECLLKPRTLNIAKGYCIEVVNDRNARIIFATNDFEGQLIHLQKLLSYCNETGRTLDSVNLMVKRNTPVTFVVAEAPALEPKKLSSGSSGSKTRKN